MRGALADWGTLPVPLALAIAATSTVLGVAASLIAGSDPGGILGFFVLVGTVAAAFAVPPRQAYLFIPVPALTYLAGAMATGYVHDHSMDTSHTALAINATQWVAGGFVSMTAATVVVAVIALFRWLNNRTRLGAGAPRRRPVPARAARNQMPGEPYGDEYPRHAADYGRADAARADALRGGAARGGRRPEPSRGDRFADAPRADRARGERARAERPGSDPGRGGQAQRNPARADRNRADAPPRPTFTPADAKPARKPDGYRGDDKSRGGADYPVYPERPSAKPPARPAAAPAPPGTPSGAPSARPSAKPRRNTSTWTYRDDDI